jgi:hypothetical protein
MKGKANDEQRSHKHRAFLSSFGHGGLDETISFAFLCGADGGVRQQWRW